MVSRVLGKLLFIIALLTPLGAGLFRVWVNQDAVQVGYALSEKSSRRGELRTLARQLEVELASLKSPERLSVLAKKLGLTPASPDRIFGERGASHER